VTIVGLGVGIAALMCFVIAVYASQIFFASWLGETLLGASAGVGLMIGRMALGLGIVRVAIGLPYIGFYIGALVTLWGLGAMVLTLYGRMRPSQPAAA